MKCSPFASLGAAGVAPALALLLAGCTSSGIAPNPPGGGVGTQKLFAANCGNNTVTEYAPPYTGTPTIISNGLNCPVGLALSSSGDLFAANYNSNTVTEYAPPYTAAPTTTISTDLGPTLEGLAISK